MYACVRARARARACVVWCGVVWGVGSALPCEDPAESSVRVCAFARARVCSRAPVRAVDVALDSIDWEGGRGWRGGGGTLGAHRDGHARAQGGGRGSRHLGEGQDEHGRGAGGVDAEAARRAQRGLRGAERAGEWDP